MISDREWNTDIKKCISWPNYLFFIIPRWKVAGDIEIVSVSLSFRPTFLSGAYLKK
jgi:hypothetical protein